MGNDFCSMFFLLVCLCFLSYNNVFWRECLFLVFFNKTVFFPVDTHLVIFCFLNAAILIFSKQENIYSSFAVEYTVFCLHLYLNLFFFSLARIFFFTFFIYSSSSWICMMVSSNWVATNCSLTCCCWCCWCGKLSTSFCLSYLYSRCKLCGLSTERILFWLIYAHTHTHIHTQSVSVLDYLKVFICLPFY